MHFDGITILISLLYLPYLNYFGVEPINTIITDP